MAGKTLEIENVINPDQTGCEIARMYHQWDISRHSRIEEWRELQKYIFATDTTKTTNSKLPWSNKTTIPKLCQIRDNLHANYMSALFPKRKWLRWMGDSLADEDIEKRRAIEGYMLWAIDRPEFYNEISKLVLDYIDYGQPFGVPHWVDNRVETKDGQKVGFVGPMVRRISPVDIVFNPTAPSFFESPKIVRSLVPLGEVKDMLLAVTTDDGEREQALELWNYMKDIRNQVASVPTSSATIKDSIYEVAGYGSYQEYLGSGFVEVLTFYGDLYDIESDKFYKNYIIKVVDRHKVIYKEPNPSAFGQPQIYSVGWRVRPDNLWAMGPLDNLVGMQYRIDHLENIKADIFDLTAMPLIKVKGYVEDFEWRPMEKIFVGDDGDVATIAPDVQALQADTQIAILEAKMEEMAGSPKEAMGFRTPGEKTKYEVQRLEVAAGRIFQHKTAQFERDFLEPLLNGMLELARRHLDKASVRVFDTEFKVNLFSELSNEDITGNGRLRPYAARHFAEVSNRAQNLTQFFSSSSGQDPNVLIHFSGEKLAHLWEEILELEDYAIVQPYVRVAEMADQQRMTQSLQEQVAVEANTPTGIYPGDYDEDVANEPPQGQASNSQPQLPF